MVPCCRSISWNESELVVTKSDFKEDPSLNTKLDFKDSGLDTNQTLRTRRSTDFKSASLDYKEGNSVMELLVLQDLVFKRMDSMEFLRGLESALGLEYVIWHPVLLALNFGSIGKLSFLGPDQSLQFFSQLLSFYSVHLTCNTIWGSGIDVDFDSYSLVFWELWMCGMNIIYRVNKGFYIYRIIYINKITLLNNNRFELL
ncbi:unnamed protein product [Rhizophagus irregularis]|nr:unnamed protein product [Rhizophagus irregularis]